MRIFIAGATGVLGRRMVGQFTEKNHRVIGLARDEEGKQTIQRLGGEAVVGDIYNADSDALRRVEALRHGRPGKLQHLRLSSLPLIN